jgi:sugar phosphate permease
LFYGWVVIAMAVATMTLVYGIRHSFSVFFPPILAEFGWSRGSTAAMLSLNILFYGLTAPFAGRLCDRWMPTRVMVMGVLILGAATAACSRATELWHFYVLFGFFMPIGTAFCGWPVIAPALANWFSKRRALALGLGQTGGGLSFTYAIFAEFAISQFGWSHAYLVLAGVLVLVLLPLTRLFAYHPESKRLAPYGSEQVPGITGVAGAVSSQSRSSAGWTLRDAIHTYQLWLLVFSYFLFWGFATYQVLAHQVKFVVDVGYSSVFAASVFGLFGIFLVAGQLSGFISDAIGREATVAISGILAVAAMLSLLTVQDASQSWRLYVHAVCLGYSVGLYSPAVVAGMADFFHGSHFGSIAGLLLTGQGVGGALGPWLAGHIHDVTGSYFPAFVLCTAAYAVACAAFIVAAPRKADRLEKRL